MSDDMLPNHPSFPVPQTVMQVQHLSAEELTVRQTLEMLMQRVTRLEADITLLRAQDAL